MTNTISQVQANAIVENILNDVPHINPFLYAMDSYKVSHKRFETSGVTEIYSNFTARFGKYLKQLLGDAYDEQYVVFGVQWMLLRLHTMAKTGFFDKPKEEVINKMKKVHGAYIGNTDFEHFEALHDLGYLPIVVKALDEGTVTPIGTPFFTIRNTLPEFEWLPNLLETVISTDTWKQLTVATIARAFRKISNEYALETVGSLEGTEWQNHDFSCRGQSGLESSAINGAAFLTSSCGTDNVVSLWACEKFYQSTNDEGLLAGSVPAGEHSVTTSGILTAQERLEATRLVDEGVYETEREAVKALVEEKCREMGITLLEAETDYVVSVLEEKFPAGIVAYVADSFDFWSFVSKIIPSVKDKILARDGKFVVRGDSGNPVDVICGFEDADVKDLVARNLAEELVPGDSFTVDGQVYKLISYPPVGDDQYLPFFSLEENGFVKKWDQEAEEKAFEELAKQVDAEVAELMKLEQTFETVTKIADLILTKSEANFFVINDNHVVVQAEAKGTIEVLWEIFGGTMTEKGYKMLNEHISMIYGDGINVQRSQEIFRRLKKKGFATLNIVFGVGSYSLNMISRDFLGMAIKATNQIVNVHGVDLDHPIYKDPKTDTSKKSARGLLKVYKNEDGKIVFDDMQTREQEETGLLSKVYENGEFKKLTNIFEIRDRIWG